MVELKAAEEEQQQRTHEMHTFSHINLKADFLIDKGAKQHHSIFNPTKT